MNNYDELRQAEEAATPGPWSSLWAPGAIGRAGEHAINAGDAEANLLAIRVSTQDAAFIVLMRNNFLALLDENEALRAALRNLLPGQVQLDAIRAAEVALGDAS